MGGPFALIWNIFTGPVFFCPSSYSFLTKKAKEAKQIMVNKEEEVKSSFLEMLRRGGSLIKILFFIAIDYLISSSFIYIIE